MKVEWKGNKWVSEEVEIVPMLDSDGYDFFFYRRGNKLADARFCSGEAFWVFYNKSEEVLNSYLPAIEIILTTDWGDELANKLKEALSYGFKRTGG